MNLEASQGFELIVKAIENDSRDRMYQQWLHDSARFENQLSRLYESVKAFMKIDTRRKRRNFKKIWW